MNPAGMEFSQRGFAGKNCSTKQSLRDLRQEMEVSCVVVTIGTATQQNNFCDVVQKLPSFRHEQKFHTKKVFLYHHILPY